MGHAQSCFAWLRNLATAKRIPGHAGSGTKEGIQQTAKVAKIGAQLPAVILVGALAIGGGSGCQSSTGPVGLSSHRLFSDRSKLISFSETEADQDRLALKSETTTGLAIKTSTSPQRSKDSKFRQVGFQEVDNEQQQTERIRVPEIEIDQDLKPDSDPESAVFEPQGLEELDDEEALGGLPVPEDDDVFSEAEELETPPESVRLNVNLDSNGQTLTLQQVLRSVTNSYPEIEVAIGEIESAAGKVLASWGEFDRIASAHSISQPLGFYQTYRNGAGIHRPLYSGGSVGLDYRIGDGNFEPWFGERETNEAGEFKASFDIPLLKDREIDARRAKLLSAQAKQQEVEADVEARLLTFQRFAIQAYWDWVAAGKAVSVQNELLSLAKKRVFNFNERIKKGDVAKVAVLGNNAFIAKRENNRLKAEQAFIKTSIKLSLFNRDATGIPVKAGLDQIPPDFPDATRIDEARILQDTQAALALRPEFAALRAARQAVLVDAKFAENLTLPKLDVKGFAGQDIGGETSSLGDKTPFELQIGVLAEVPLERRKGLGQLQVARGKLSQIDAKLQFVSDKVRAEVQSAAFSINAAFEQIQQSERNVDYIKRTLEISRKQFDAGDIDLISLNIVETLVAEAEFQLIDAQFKYFVSLAAYEAAISGQAFTDPSLQNTGVPQ